MRQCGKQLNGGSLWWSMHGRNKLSIAVDLKQQKGRDIVLRLAAQSDAVDENFRPAQQGLGSDDLRRARPDLMVAYVSGYGQDRPYRDRSAFGVIAEAVGGLRYLTNRSEPDDEPPVRMGVRLGDSLAELYAAFGIVAALWNRDRSGCKLSPLTVDVALADAVLSLTESILPEYSALSKVKQPTGSAFAAAAPRTRIVKAEMLPGSTPVTFVPAVCTCQI